MAQRQTARTSIIICIVIVSALATIFACSGPGPAGIVAKSLKDYNLIIINIDSLRRDHLSCYGYDRETSPTIDSLAQSGILFERSMSNSSYTGESVAVLMSGLLPSSSGVFGWKAHPSGKVKNLASLFREAGYRTGFFSSTIVLKAPQFTEGFDEAEFLFNDWGTSRGGPKLSVRALQFAQHHAGKKFLMYLHYLDPHGPYLPPDSFYLRFADKRFPDPVNVYFDLRPRFQNYIREGFGPGEPRFDDMVTRYDAEIAHTDEAIRMLVAGLEKLNLLESTLIIISADHGEEFLEHGFIEHAWTLYQESLKTPLIFWAPKALPEARIPDIVSTVDILPTVLELMNVPHDRKDFDGTSLFTRQGDHYLFKAPEKPFIGELLLEERNVLRTVIQGDHKYIVAYKWLQPMDRPAAVVRQKELRKGISMPTEQDKVDVWGQAVHEEYYILQSDPDERQNLIHTNADNLNKLKNVLSEYISKCSSRQGRGQDSENDEKMRLSPEELEDLRTLGYL